MLRVTFISDDNVQTKLCESTRNLAEHNLTLNGQRVIQLESLFRSTYQAGFDRKNKRLQVSFNVSRDVDFGNTAFTSPEQAMIWAMDHVNGDGGAGGDNMGGRGSLMIEVTGVSGYAAVRYLRNCVLHGVELVNASLGICLELRYTFSGGLLEIA